MAQSFQQAHAALVGGNSNQSGGGSSPGVVTSFQQAHQQLIQTHQQSAPSSPKVTNNPVRISPTPQVQDPSILDRIKNGLANVGKTVLNAEANLPQAHFADTINQYTPAGWQGKVTALGAGIAQGAINMLPEYARNTKNVISDIKTHNTNVKQVAGDVAGAVANSPLLLLLGDGLGKGVAEAGKAVLPTVIKTGGKALTKDVVLSALKTAGKGLAKDTAIGAGYGGLQGVASGRDITNANDYVKNLLDNIKVGAGVTGALGAVSHVVIPLAKGAGAKAGAMFVTRTGDKVKLDHMTVDPQGAQSVVVANDKLAKSPAGKAIVKASIQANESGQHVLIQPAKDGQYEAPNGEKINVGVVDPFNPPKDNPVPETAITQPKGSKLTDIKDLQSYKDEPQKSIDNAKSFMQKAIDFQGAPRKPLETITLSDGKKAIVDGNATYRAALDSGYTHVPTTEADKGNLGLQHDATDEQIVSRLKKKYELEPHIKALHQEAIKAQPDFENKVNEIASELGMEAKNAAPKSREGILRKTLSDNEGDLSRMKDVNRATILVKDPADLQHVVDRVKSKFGDDVIIKDKFAAEGYKSANINVRLRNGKMAEIQVTTPEMNHAKFTLGGHKLYENVRIKGERWEKDNEKSTQLYKDAHAATLRRLNAASEVGTPSARALSGGYGEPDAVTPTTSSPSRSTLTNVPSTSKNIGKSDNLTIDHSSSDSIAENEAKNKGNTEESPNNSHAAQEPVGTGNPRESAAYKHFVEDLAAKDPELYEKIKDDPKLLYNKVNQEYNFEKAMEFVQKDPQKAYDVSKGYTAPPEGLRINDVAIVLADRARSEKNLGLMVDLQRSMSLRATRAGQEIVALRGRFTDTSPQAYVQKLLDMRLKKLGGESGITNAIDMAAKKFGKDLSTAKSNAIAKIDRVVEKAQQFTKKERQKIDFAQKLLDELTCK